MARDLVKGAGPPERSRIAEARAADRDVDLLQCVVLRAVRYEAAGDGDWLRA
jgi:hypothetical protein